MPEFYGDINTMYSICGTPITKLKEGVDPEYAGHSDYITVGYQLCERCKKNSVPGVENPGCARHFPIAYVRGQGYKYD